MWFGYNQIKSVRFREALHKPFYTCVTHVSSLFVCDFVFPTHVIVYWEHTRRGQLERFDWESNIFPRSAILPFVKVSGSTVLMSSGLQRGPSVVITVRKGVKYVEDQNRRYDQDKMLPLLYRILILRKNFLRICVEQWGTKLSSWWPQKVTRWQIFRTRLWQVYWYQ